MWDNKNKAVTLSFDDGAEADVKLIEILDKYGLKATFNLNSGYLGLKWGKYVKEGNEILSKKVDADKLKEIYKNHEVAGHTLIHPTLTYCSESAIIHQVETDRKFLSELCGYEVVGFAYPGNGGPNTSAHAAKVIKEKTGIKYARTNVTTKNFDIQTDLYNFNPTCYFVDDKEETLKLAKEFVELKTDEPKLFYAFGHSYEFDADTYGLDWDYVEEFCKIISGKSDIYYGTNKDVLL